MSGLKKPTILRQSSYNSHYSNPLINPNNSNNHSEKSTDAIKITPLGKTKKPMKVTKVLSFGHDKENNVPNKEGEDGKLQNCKKDGGKVKRVSSSSSLQLCIQMNEPDSSFGFGFGFGLGCKVWDFSDSEADPVSSWFTLPNRALLCRRLPVDVGKCTCIIQKEVSPMGLNGGSFFSLFTNEGHGRQNRKLAVAYHKRRKGRSIFVIAQNTKGSFSRSDDSFVGVVTSNLMGSKYFVSGQCRSPRRKSVNDSELLQVVVKFVPTIRTWTGSYRSIRAWIPKQEPLQSKNTNNQTQHMKGLPIEWDGKQVPQLLVSKVPYYNKKSKQYELDFRDKVKAGLKIQSSVKNFQLIMEGNGEQTILQLGRISKSKYVFDYRHPLTGFQAFCICLASIDPKLCCTV